MRIFLIIILYYFSTLAQATDKKIIYVNSYHRGYAWSDGIAQGIRKVFADEPIDLKVIELDTRRHPEESFKQQAAQKAQAVIEATQPDVVIISDDNAAKYLMMPYYKNAALPFVFCGLNWDVSEYDLPYQNTTGMVEVALTRQIIQQLKKYAQGERLGFLAADALSERKSYQYHLKLLNIKYDKAYFAKTFAQWQRYYLTLQDEVDMLIILSHVGINDWDDAQAQQFVETHTRIPTGTELDLEMPVSLLGITKVAEEQGRWAAHAALKILQGVAPHHIPITRNQQGKAYFNLKIAEQLAIKDIPAFAELIR